jgi:hypothetical protein
MRVATKDCRPTQSDVLTGAADAIDVETIEPDHPNTPYTESEPLTREDIIKLTSLSSCAG